MAEEQDNIKQNFNFAQTGLNMDLLPSQLKQGMLSYSLNSAVENFDANGISYQNEAGNTYCLSFPEEFVQIGTYFPVHLSDPGLSADQDHGRNPLGCAP